MTLGSLFDGSGGFPLAGMLAGITPVWASEVEPFAIRVTTKRFPFMKHYGDISKMNGGEVEPVDIITFGSPCQNLSIAGKREGLNGAKSGLYIQAVRIVKEMLKATKREFPKFCVFENVPGLLSSNKGDDFIACMDMMQNLGFLPDPNILDAQDMGVPQRRKRVFIVWVNVDYILSRKTDISRSITLQLHTEILQTILAGLLKASGEELQKSVVNDARFTEDGLRKRIKLFSLQKESRLSMLQSVLDETQAMYGTEQKSSDGNPGGGRTADAISTTMDTKSITLKTERRFGHTEWSLRKESDEALNLMKSFITSTLTKETINRKTCFYLKVLLNTLDVIIHLMQSQKNSDAILNQRYEWVLHTLIWLEGYTNAKRKHDKSVEGMEWDDCLRFLKSSISACKKLLVADFAGESAGKVLFESEGLSGYSAEGFRSWQRAAGGAAHRAGTTGEICLNDQGGSRMDVSEEVTSTLRAEAHHPPCVLEAAGFCTEHSADSRGIGYEPEKSPTLRAGVVPAAVYENHSQDTRYTGPLEVVPTVSAKYGSGGNNQPFVVRDEPPKTLKIRSGCAGGGKGPLVQEDKSATLSCSNDQTVFVPKAFGISSAQSHAMLSDNPHSGIYEADTSRTIDTSGGNPGCNQGGIAIVAFAQNQRCEVRGLGGRAGALSARPGMKQSTYIMEEPQNGKEYDTPAAVVYGIGRDTFNQGKNAKFTPSFTKELQPTLVAKGPGAVQNGYTVRRLTPTECARLQGFPDWWCEGLSVENPSENEILFWRCVFETHRTLMGTSSKPKTDRQIIKWLKAPNSDSAEYRLWGNGVALPCVYFILAGIVWASEEEK